MDPLAPGAEAPDDALEASSDMEHLAKLLWPLANAKRLDLLAYLTEPHYLEEIASHLGLTRQAARKHVDVLCSIGVLQRTAATRPSGAVVEYCIDRRALFLIWQEFEKLGALRPQASQQLVAYTRVGTTVDQRPGPPTGPALWVVHGLAAGAQFALHQDAQETWLIGRDARSDIHIDYDPYVSTRHAEVHAQGQEFVLTDLASRNGTEHNGATLPRGGEVILRHGDLIGVGRTLFLFWQRRPDGP